MFLIVALSVSDFIISTLELSPYPIKESNSKIENVSHTCRRHSEVVTDCLRLSLTYVLYGSFIFHIEKGFMCQRRRCAVNCEILKSNTSAQCS